MQHAAHGRSNVTVLQAKLRAHIQTARTALAGPAKQTVVTLNHFCCGAPPTQQLGHSIASTQAEALLRGHPSMEQEEKSQHNEGAKRKPGTLGVAEIAEHSCTRTIDTYRQSLYACRKTATTTRPHHSRPDATLPSTPSEPAPHDTEGNETLLAWQRAP